MIKKIIFDLDNTLIPWEDEKNWNKVYQSLSKQFQITEEQLKTAKSIINNYELLEDIFNAEIMQKMVNDALQKQYPIQFIQTILNTFAECVPEQTNTEVEEVLQYLNNKYELVVLTNWFAWQQEKRLEKYGISQYFSNVYGADKFKVKPNKEAFEIAVGADNKNECIMIGDGIKNDVEAAINNGITAILYNPNYNEDKDNEEQKQYKTIKSFKELKQTL